MYKTSDSTLFYVPLGTAIWIICGMEWTIVDLNHMEYKFVKTRLAVTPIG